MPSCQAINCTNTKGKCSKSFFEIPDPSKSAQKGKLCKLWIHHLRNDKLNIESFVWSKSRVVCEDHFEDSCFHRSTLAGSLGFKASKPRLKPGAIPTIVNIPKAGSELEVKSKEHRTLLLEKRKRAQVTFHPKWCV